MKLPAVEGVRSAGDSRPVLLVACPTPAAHLPAPYGPVVWTGATFDLASALAKPPHLLEYREEDSELVSRYGTSSCTEHSLHILGSSGIRRGNRRRTIPRDGTRRLEQPPSPDVRRFGSIHGRYDGYWMFGWLRVKVRRLWEVK